MRPDVVSVHERFLMSCAIFASSSSTARLGGHPHAARSGVFEEWRTAAQHRSSEAYPADAREELEEPGTCVVCVVPCIIIHPRNPLRSVSSRGAACPCLFACGIGHSAGARFPIPESLIAVIFHHTRLQARLQGASMSGPGGVWVNVMTLRALPRLRGSGNLDLNCTLRKDAFQRIILS